MTHPKHIFRCRITGAKASVLRVAPCPRHEDSRAPLGPGRADSARRLPGGPLKHVAGLGADRGLGELLQDVRQFWGNVDLLRAEHGLGKRHRSLRTRLGRIKVCCGEEASPSPSGAEQGSGVWGGAGIPGVGADQEAVFARKR